MGKITNFGVYGNGFSFFLATKLLRREGVFNHGLHGFTQIQSARDVYSTRLVLSLRDVPSPRFIHRANFVITLSFNRSGRKTRIN